jgi:hypothetical protein
MHKGLEISLIDDCIGSQLDAPATHARCGIAAEDNDLALLGVRPAAGDHAQARPLLQQQVHDDDDELGSFPKMRSGRH